MQDAFRGTHTFDGNISSWDVSSVTDMSHMFSGARSFNQPLSSWDVSSVTDMNGMFSGARSFNGDLSTWNVSSVTDMRERVKQRRLLQRRHLRLGRFLSGTDG